MLLNLIKRAISFVLRRTNLADLDGSIYERRIILSLEIDKICKSTIQYGPFAGMLLSKGDWWGKIDRPSMLFGFYEKEVLDSLTNHSNKFKTLIDIGAADGYYAIGGVLSGSFENSVCYEISEDGQAQIRKNAYLNNIADKIEVRGKAKKKFFDDFSEEELGSSLILMDIEGGEYDILSSKEDFMRLKKSTLIIESHALFFDDGIMKQENLVSLASEFFNITEFKTSSRDLSIYPELKNYSDSDRWLMCSEGRGELMSWFRLDPK